MHISKLSKRTVKYCILSHFYTPLSTVNQNSTPPSTFSTPQDLLCASMIALTMERPMPLPPYSLVLALSTL